MKNAIWAMLTPTEQELLRQTEPASLRELDEDALVELHTRVRRTRDKYAKLYRRRARAQVEDDATRARAHAVHARTSAKAEAFEDTLARVSTALAKAARHSANTLKAERLAAARRESGRPATVAGASRDPGAATARTTGRTAAKRRSPIAERSNAANRAATKQSQAKRDAR
jgi:hypothetical protein